MQAVGPSRCAPQPGVFLKLKEGFHVQPAYRFAVAARFVWLLFRPWLRRLYDNGAINGTTDGWTINFGFVVSDTFTLSTASTVTGLNFGAWVFPGDTLTSAEVSITSSEFGGTTYSDQVVAFTQQGCTGNQYGYNVCTESGSLTGVAWARAPTG